VGNGTDDQGGDSRRHSRPGAAAYGGWDAGLNSDDAPLLATLVERANEQGPSHVIVARADLLWLVNWALELMDAQLREIPELRISDEEYRQVLGRNLTRVRRLCGVSQRQLAQRMNVRRSMIGDYEHARRELTLGVLRDIAGGLRVPIGLLAREWEETPFATEPLFFLQPESHPGW
jgi:DNA-binding XRE family transcriptional regulator